MKSLVIAAVAVLGLASVAGAEPLTAAHAGFGVNGYGEYTLEAKGVELGLNATYGFDAVTLSGGVVAAKANGGTLDVDHYALGALYTVSDNASVYGKVDLDDKFKYSETTVGVAFKF